MNKKLIVAAVAVPVLLASGIAASAYFSSECKYDMFTGNFVANGEVYAHGTMEDAWVCALAGILPQSVISQLGKYGDSSTRAEAQKIIEKDEEMKKQRKEK
jgi:hypothetical protein